MAPTNPSHTQDAATPDREPSSDPAHRRRSHVSVGEIMTTDVASCSLGDTLNRCAQIMWERCCGSVPVIGADGRPTAIVTDRDISMAAYIQGKPLKSIRVTSAMSKQLFTVEVHASVSTAQRIMRRHGVRRLVVVDRTGQLAGLISIDDILGHASRAATSPHGPFSSDAIADTVEGLRHVSRPVRS